MASCGGGELLVPSRWAEFIKLGRFDSGRAMCGCIRGSVNVGVDIHKAEA
jgi:hypothetical protein